MQRRDVMASPIFFCLRLAHDVFDDVTGSAVAQTAIVARSIRAMHGDAIEADKDRSSFHALQHLMGSR